MTWPPKPPKRDPDAAARRAIRKALSEKGAKPKRPRQYPEEAEQKALVHELRWRTIKPARFWAVPNQRGTRLKWEQKLMVALGLEAGVSDMHFAWEGRRDLGEVDHRGRGVSEPEPRFGVIEMKAPGRLKATTEEQDQYLRDMASCGHRTAVCDTAKQAIETLEAWGFPLRRRHEA